MAKPPIPHRVVRTRNRHSRAVYRGNTIEIRLARNLSRSEEKEHVESLLRRMTRRVLQEFTKNSLDPFRELLNGAERSAIQLNTGTQYVIELSPGKETRAHVTPKGWTVEVGPGMRRRTLHQFLWRLLSLRETPQMTFLVEEINAQTFRASLGHVRLRFMSSQWGSCSRRRSIVLNTALLFTPPELLTYVIIHELGHMRVTNHSTAYWKHVAQYMPHFAERRRELSTFRICGL